jgi:Carboxypeptidase regulatory-like domain/TonB dependent receptor-like, beta-barrel
MRLTYIVVLCFLLGPTSPAQVTTGSVSGYALDPSGLSISGATVTLENERHSLRRTALSDTTGFYEFSELPPALYELSVDVRGFQPFQTVVAVPVDHHARVDVRLVIAGKGEHVVVSARSPVINTESPELGAVLDQSRIMDLPLNERDFLQLSLLVAGVAPPVEDSQLSTRGTFAMHVNGGREEFNNFLLDGVDNDDSDTRGYTLEPPVDTIQEFKIATSTYSAEYGVAGAGQVNIITRSGSNDLHGTAYEYLRNRAVDARNFFDGPGETKYIRNQFGLGIGGPIRKNQTFFYANYDGLREEQQLTQLGTVPIPAVRQGDLSSLGTPVVNPFTGQQYPGNIIPASQISPYAADILRLFPLPNLPGASGNYLGTPLGTTMQNQGDGRIDQRLTDHAQLTLRYSYGRRELVEPFAENQVELPGFGDNVDDRGHNALIHVQQLFGPQVNNSVILGFNRAIRKILPQNQSVNVNALWGVNYLPTVPRDFGYPGISVVGYSRVGDVASLPIDRAGNTYQLSDNLSIIRGGHSLAMGVEIRDLQENGYIEVYSRGQIDFTGALTQTGIGDLLLGLPTLGIQSHYTGPQTLRTQGYGAYIQDDWKIARNLTLNLGLRYEYFTPPTDPTNRMATFDFQTAQLVQVGTNGTSRSGTRPDRTGFEPRLGFAWSPIERLVIRGGYGIYYDEGMFDVNSSLYFNPPFFTVSVFFPTAQSLLTLADPFAATNGYVPPAQLSIVSPNFVPGYVQQWNLNVQREIPRAGVLTLAYAASKGTHLPRSLDINQPPYPGPGPISSRAPYPAYSNILMTESGGNSDYQSFQVTFNRPLSKGLSILAAYTFSKSIDDTSAFLPVPSDQNFPQDSHNYRLERALSSFDMPNRATVALVYDLPGSSVWIRGFTLSGILTAQSGQPFTPMLSTDNSNTGNTGGNFGVDRPNVVGSTVLANPSAEEWFNTAAFAIPPEYTWGNAGRNILRGPGLFTMDVSLRRTFNVSERLRLIAEAQAFNVENRVNFNQPDAFADQPLTFGKIFSAKDPRQIQFALRFQF